MARSFIESALERIGEQRYSEALRILKRGLKRMPAGWQPIQPRGKGVACAFWSSQEFIEYALFRGSCESVQWITPSYSQAWYWVAHCQWEMGRGDAAENAIAEAIRLEPDHPESLCEAAYFVQESEAWSEALDLYRRAASGRSWITDAQRALALRGQGYCLIELWQFDEAATALLESLRHEPSNVVARGELKFLQQKREEVERREGLTTEERARLYPPVLAGTREMLRFAAGVPPVAGARTVGRDNYRRIREAFEETGWLGFEYEFLSLFPEDSSETQARKAQLLRDPVFRTAGGPGFESAPDTGQPPGTDEGSRPKRLLQ